MKFGRQLVFKFNFCHKESEIQAFSYRMNKSRRRKVQPGEYSQWYFHSAVQGQMVAILGWARHKEIWNHYVARLKPTIIYVNYTSVKTFRQIILVTIRISAKTSKQLLSLIIFRFFFHPWRMPISRPKQDFWGPSKAVTNGRSSSQHFWGGGGLGQTWKRSSNKPLTFQ